MSSASDFIIENGVLTEYVGPGGDVAIPEGVTAIGEFAFSNSSITAVTIPKNVKSIEWNAFMNCRNLKSVSLPKSDIKIGIGAFFGCRNLTDIVIPEGVTTMGSGAFSDCWNLKKIILPKTLTSVESRIFYGGARLKSITINASRMEMPKGQFGLFQYEPPRDFEVFAPNLSLSVLQEQGMGPAAVRGFFKQSSKYTDPAIVTQYALYIASQRKKLLPDVLKRDMAEILRILADEKKITKKNVTQDYYQPAVEYKAAKCAAYLEKRFGNELGRQAEALSSERERTKDFKIEKGILTKYTGPGGNVVIPEGVTEIGKEVFAKSKTLTGVTFPQSLIIIGAEAFASCNGLTSVTIPRGVTEIRFGAFDWCKNLKDVYIDDLAAWCRIEFGGVFANCGNPLSAGAHLHMNGKVLTELVIPEGVENVGNYAFFRCADLENIVVPESVTSIGEYSFFECTNLKSISLPDNLTSIGGGAFLRCKKLTEVKIPKTVTSIGDRAFMECRKLADVILSEGVELLGDQAFGDCGQLRISLPGSLKRPKADMFGRLWEKAPFAGSVCSIRIEKWSALITKMVDGCTIEEVSTANYSLIPGEILLPVATSMMKKKGWVTSSETGKALLKGLEKNAEKLRAAALTNAEWLQLLCDNKLIKAEDLDAWLEEAEKQNNTAAKAMLLNYQGTIGSKAVGKAREKKEKDKEAYADALVERAAKRDPSNGIQGMTFVITGQMSAWPKVWSSRKEVEEYLAKYGAKLGSSLTKETDYLVTNDTENGSAKNEKTKKLGVEVISEEEFNQMIGRRFADEETICVPSWVKAIEPAAFSYPDWESWKDNYGYKKLKEVILPEQITSIGEKAFAGAGELEKISIPDTVTSIGSWAFADCNQLKTIVLPEKLQRIGARAFDGCSGLTKLIIPENTKEIESYAFAECSSLEEMDIPASVETIDMGAFDKCPKLTIRAPEGSFAAQYARRNAIPLVVEGMVTNETTEQGDLRDFVIENGVLTQYLGAGGDVTIPDGVLSIGPMAFYNCLGLKNVIVPEGVTSISFFNCSNLIRVTIPSSVTSVYFFGCSSLEEVTLPVSVDRIGDNAFYGCSSLKSIVIPGSVAEVGEGAFSFCKGLQTIVFSEGVESLGKNVLFCCNSLKDVFLPASLKKIHSSNYFSGITIHAPAKSFAEKYAKRHKKSFEIWEKE